VDDEERKQRRAFIRAHHPDVGGDSADFIAGLARFDPPDATGPAQVQLRVYLVPDQPWPAGIVTAVLRRIRRARRSRVR